jgi:hypothetical protein
MYLAAAPDAASIRLDDRRVVSVCGSAYDVGRHLEEAPRSTVRETYSNLEPHLLAERRFVASVESLSDVYDAARAAPRR